MNESEREFYERRKKEINLDVRRGLTAHYRATSELTDEENTLVMLFLERHNLVFSRSPVDGIFSIRRNNHWRPKKEEVVLIQSKEIPLINLEDFQYTDLVESKAVSLIEQDLSDLRKAIRSRKVGLYEPSVPLFPWG